MTGKHSFVVGRLLTEINQVLLLEDNVVSNLHYAKIMENLRSRRVTSLNFMYRSMAK